MGTTLKDDCVGNVLSKEERESLMTSARERYSENSQLRSGSEIMVSIHKYLFDVQDLCRTCEELEGEPAKWRIGEYVVIDAKGVLVIRGFGDDVALSPAQWLDCWRASGAVPQPCEPRRCERPDKDGLWQMRFAAEGDCPWDIAIVNERREGLFVLSRGGGTEQSALDVTGAEWYGPICEIPPDPPAPSPDPKPPVPVRVRNVKRGVAGHGFKCQEFYAGVTEHGEAFCWSKSQVEVIGN